MNLKIANVVINKKITCVIICEITFCYVNFYLIINLFIECYEYPSVYLSH